MFLGGQVYLCDVQLLSHILGLPLCGLQTRLSTLASLDRFLELFRQPHMFLLEGSIGLLNLETRVGLGLNLLAGVPDPLLNYIYLLSNLHKKGKGVMKVSAYINEHVT